MKIDDLQKISQPTSGMPVRGYVVSETSAEISIQDDQGTWVFAVGDVLGRVPWAGKDPRFTGEAICLFIRDGAVFFEIKRFKVELQSRPLTLSGPEATTTGAKVAANVANDRELQWLRKIGFAPDEAISPHPWLRNPKTFCETGEALPPVDDCGW